MLNIEMERLQQYSALSGLFEIKSNVNVFINYKDRCILLHNKMLKKISLSVDLVRYYLKLLKHVESRVE